MQQRQIEKTSSLEYMGASKTFRLLKCYFTTVLRSSSMTTCELKHFFWPVETN